MWGDILKGLKKALCVFTIVCIALQFGAAAENKSENQNTGNEPLVNTYSGELTYKQYEEANKKYPEANQPVSIDVTKPLKLENAVNKTEGSVNSVFLNESGYVVYKIEVPETALYTVKFNYMLEKGKGRNGELSFMVNDKKLFDYNNVVLQRIYKDNEIKQDNRGNDLRPARTEVRMWAEASLRDIKSYNDNEFLIRFEKGANTITLKSERESFYLSDLKLSKKLGAVSYRDYINSYKKYDTVKNITIKQQAELIDLKSNTGIALQADRSNPDVEFNSPSLIKLNKIGANTWKSSGQWVSWTITAEKEGLYALSFRYRQNIIRGLDTKRRLYIDGAVPFEEAMAVSFPYTNDWSTVTLGGKNPYYIYLKPGKHEIKLEAVIGKIGGYIESISNSVLEMSSLYRRIVMVTGRVPDKFRDYDLDKEIPNLIDRFKNVRDNLQTQAKAIDKLSPQLGNETAFIYEVVRQLDGFIKEPHTIQQRLTNLESNISALASLALRLKDQPLELDYFELTSPDVKIKNNGTNPFGVIAYRFQSFFYSFLNDYSSIGNTYSNESKPLNVWVSANDVTTTGVSSGRDQAQIIKSLIDDDFTKKYNTPVNLSLVNTYDTMMQAVMSGNGPDVAILIPESMVINLSARSVLEDFKKYNAFREMKDRVFPSSLIAYEYNGGTYAIPETQVYFMMFYRKDIFKELKLTPPTTWNEFHDVTNKLQKKNMQVGIPESTSVYEMLLFQNGGNVYNNDLSRVTLTDKKAVTAFQMWTDLYLKYGLPLVFDFVTMFRTGEMPLGIMTFTTYNQLKVAAPEIDNLWEMVPVPGIKDSNGSINRSQSCVGTGAILFSASKYKEKGCQFINWWTSDEIQTNLGYEIESLIGASSRYNTANKEAFSRMAWSKQELDSLSKASIYVSDVYQTPATYYVNRNLTNAFRAVDLRYENALEVINKYSREMNKELKRKRKEFKLEK